MKVVYIEWFDAKQIDGTQSRRAANLEGLLFMHTSGMLAGEDDAVVRLAKDYWTFEDGDGTVRETFRDVEVIPKSGIQRRLDWEVGDEVGHDNKDELPNFDGIPARNRQGGNAT